MKRSLIGVFVGAVVFFIWGAVSWMFLPWHNNTIKRLPEEQLITDTLKTVVSEPGFYAFPSHQSPDGSKDDAAWAEKYRKGPVGVVVISPLGKEPMAPINFVKEILATVAIAVIGMLLLNLTRDRVHGIFSRAVLIFSLGIVVAAATHVMYWNWFSFPFGFTLINILDNCVGFFLLGLSQAKFVNEE